MIQLAFQCPFDKNNVVTGQVVSVEEPLESRLISESVSTSIVRVRPAPHQQMGYATMCPPGSLAMLTHDTSVNEYSLVLYHGPHQSRPDGWISSPLNIGFEQLEDDEENVITDFCFGQSNGQPLLATMSVHLLKASGDVIGASPILFDGAVVPRSFVRESIEYLECMAESGSHNAKTRQCRPALQFFRDAFGADDSDTPYVTARTSTGANTESSLVWPVSAQGPVLLSSMEPDEEWNRALVIEPFFARDLVGMAIGRERTGVDFGVTPTSSLLPRFDYMDGTDQEEINSMLVNLGVVVERVLVDAGEDEVPDSHLSTLVRDPVVDNMIHYASSQGVLSITTNAMRVYSNKIRGEAGTTGFMSPSTARNEEVKSMAWSSLDVSAGDHHVALAGAVVSSDALLGHTLVVALSDGKETFYYSYFQLFSSRCIQTYNLLPSFTGTPAAINLTESRYLHESESMFQADGEEVETKSSRVASEALQAMESTPPLHEVLAPYIDKINQGLAGMGKIVGGSTAQQDITPSTLGIVISVKERCEKEIVLPLQEMDKIAAFRFTELKEMYTSQLQQMAALKDTIELLKDRMKTTNEKIEVAEQNSTLLAQRSSRLLQACSDLRPTVTTAESEYFALLHRMKVKCDTWEKSIGAAQDDSIKLYEAIEAGRATAEVELDQEHFEQCRQVLHGEEISIKHSRETLEKTRDMLHSVTSATGLGACDENTSPPNTSSQ